MSVPRTGNRRLVRASASSMLREGDWSHVRYLTLNFKKGYQFREDTHTKSVLFSGGTTKGVGRVNPPDH